jgi:hypothetical protein
MVILRRRGFLWKAVVALFGASLAARFEARLERRKSRPRGATVDFMVTHRFGQPYFFGKDIIAASVAMPTWEDARFLPVYDILRGRILSAAHDVRHWMLDRGLDPHGLYLSLIEATPLTHRTSARLADLHRGWRDCIPEDLKSTPI